MLFLCDWVGFVLQYVYPVVCFKNYPNYVVFNPVFQSFNKVKRWSKRGQHLKCIIDMGLNFHMIALVFSFLNFRVSQ